MFHTDIHENVLLRISQQGLPSLFLSIVLLCSWQCPRGKHYGALLLQSSPWWDSTAPMHANWRCITYQDEWLAWIIVHQGFCRCQLTASSRYGMPILVPFSNTISLPSTICTVVPVLPRCLGGICHNSRATLALSSFTY